MNNRYKARESFYIAWNFYLKKDFDNAINYLQVSIDQYPYFVPSHILYLEIRKNFRQQLQDIDYDNLLLSDDNETFTYIKALMAQDIKEKLNLFKKSLEKNPDFFWTLYTLNILEYENPELQNNISSIIPEKETNSTYYYTKGLVCHNHKNIQKAIEYYEKSLKLNKRDANAHFNLAVAYDDSGNEELALKHYEKAINYNPYFPDAFYNLGCFYFDKKNYQKAAEYFRKTIELDEYFPDAYNNLALCYVYQQLYDIALEYIEKCILLYPNNIEYNLNYAFILFQNKKLQKAVNIYKNIIKLAPENQKAHFELGLTYLKMGQIKEFKKELKKSMKIKPDTLLFDNIKNIL